MACTTPRTKWFLSSVLTVGKFLNMDTRVASDAIAFPFLFTLFILPI